jgi:hypothetical protein
MLADRSPILTVNQPEHRLVVCDGLDVSQDHLPPGPMHWNFQHI